MTVLAPCRDIVGGMQIQQILATLVPDGDCLVWPRARFVTGYGAVRYDGRARTVHRVVWEAANGPLPDDVHLDHICSNRACANVAHLQPVDASENNRRSRERGRHSNGNRVKSACPKCGGAFTQRVGKRGPYRVCLPCRAAYLREWRAARSTERVNP